jgi:hypothetical protein
MSKYDAVYKGWLELPKIVAEAHNKGDSELAKILHDFMEKMDKAYDKRFLKRLKQACDTIEVEEKAKLN